MIPSTAARWMLSKVHERGELFPADALHQLVEMFGEEVVAPDESGSDALDQRIIEEFLRLGGGSLVWDHVDRCWRHVPVRRR